MRLVLGGQLLEWELGLRRQARGQCRRGGWRNASSLEIIVFLELNDSILWTVTSDLNKLSECMDERRLESQGIPTVLAEIERKSTILKVAEAASSHPSQDVSFKPYRLAQAWISVGSHSHVNTFLSVSALLLYRDVGKE